jgi:serine/threonine protein kinase
VDLLDNKYQIEQLLGQGGMGAVYRATHLGTTRTVAVKLIHPTLSAHDQFVARFRREAEAAGRLRHPILIGKAAVSSDITFQLNPDYSPKQFGVNFPMSSGSVFAQLLNVFVTPLTTIMASLLYLKTRRAGGESLRDASDQFKTFDIPRSKWQARMKSRWTSTHSATSNR